MFPVYTDSRNPMIGHDPLLRASETKPATPKIEPVSPAYGGNIGQRNENNGMPKVSLYSNNGRSIAKGQVTHEVGMA